MLNNDGTNKDNTANSKYTRLISDYKSLRDKHNLLKNALILEREKTKELESVISDGDVQKRKFGQEKESLVFRNDLLTKQINSLRDELDRERQRKNKKISTTKGKDVGPTNEEVEVIKEELIKKISECSGLHFQISNLQFDYQLETNNFRSAINDLENQLRLVKEQNSVVEINIRKTLAREIDERTVLEGRLESKDNLITNLESAEQNLKVEIKGLRLQLSTHPVNIPTTLALDQSKFEESDAESVLSKDILDKKKLESLNDSLASTPNDARLSSTEIYMFSLLDKIGQLEQKINSLELANQITEKRMKIDKICKDCYEDFIIQKGFELPPIGQTKDCSSSIEEQCQPDSVYETMTKFYEDKFICINKRIYEAIAKAAIYYDEAKILDCRLESMKVERDNHCSEIDILRQQIRTCQEDLDITRTQYDNKMKTMSIHITDLNSQLDSEKNWAKQQQQAFGDSLLKATDNVSSIKNFINNFKK